MNQFDRRIFLIKALIEENPEYRNLGIPSDPEAQKKLLRSLFNVRMPGLKDPAFLKVQDEYLADRAAR